MEYILDLTPGPENPRNSEGAFADLGNGEILFVYSAFNGASAMDHTDADLRAIRSLDGGRSWKMEGKPARAADFGAMNIMSVSLLKVKKELLLFYLVRKSWLEMPMVMQKSRDGGRTWDKPSLCTPENRYFVVNNDRVIQLSSGRIMIPAAEHCNKIREDGGLYFAPAQTVFFYSDDLGKTFKESSILTLNVPCCYSGLQEPGVIEGRDGTLYGWARTDLGRQYAFRSTDGGQNWTEPLPSRFTSPMSPMSVKPTRKGWLAIWNPVPTNNISGDLWRSATGGRTPLVCAISKDDGKSWSEPDIIENDPQAGYCYTAICETEDALLLGYCAGTIKDKSCLNRLRIRRIEEERQA